LAELLKAFDGLHVRWASPKEYDTLDPFTSRISPGIHVSYTPSRSDNNDPYVISMLPSPCSLGLTQSIGLNYALGCRGSGNWPATHQNLSPGPRMT
jgi:hypothetical protein